MPTRKTSAAESNQVQKAYQQFEFTSLRQTVWTAEKLCCVAPLIGEKRGLFAVFPQPAGHAAEANAVFDDPFELSVFVLLNVLVAQIDYGRRHFAGEWNSGAVSVQTVANLAVM